MKKYLASALACCMAVTLAAPAAFADAAPIKVKYSVVFGATGVQADGAKALGELIKECSDGRLEMEFYPSAQLGDKASTFEGLMAGTIEMTECSASDLSVFNDIWSVFSLPYLWDSDQQAVKTANDEAVRKILEEDAENNGFKIIAWTAIGSRSIVNSKRSVHTPDDLKGLKIRCMEDPILAESINAMGAIGTPMAFSEVYTALQQGTIDGTEHTPANVAANSWYEVCKYYSLTEQFIIPDPVFVSKVWFDRQTPENQAALLEAGKKFEAAWNSEIWPTANEAGMKILKDNGMEVLEVDKEPFKANVKSFVDKYLSKASSEQKEFYDLLVTTGEKYK